MWGEIVYLYAMLLLGAIIGWVSCTLLVQAHQDLDMDQIARQIRSDLQRGLENARVARNDQESEHDSGIDP